MAEGNSEKEQTKLNTREIRVETNKIENRKEKKKPNRERLITGKPGSLRSPIKWVSVTDRRKVS